MPSRVICFPLQQGQVRLLISTSLFTGSFRSLLSLAVAQAGPPDRLAGAEEDLLPLVVEVGTAVDVVEVLEGELGSAPLRCGSTVQRPRPPRRQRGLQDGATASVSPASCGLADGLDELRHLLQGGTVLGVVGRAACPSSTAPWPAPSVPATPGSATRRRSRPSRCSPGIGQSPSGRWRRWGSRRWRG